MRTEVIPTYDIDEVVEGVINELKKDNTDDSRCNVIYFDGWDGLGASAVLRRVAQLLTPTAKADEPVFHIDCSKWESRRAMQRMIAEQMGLPASIMEMFDAQDEDDDFRGVAKDSRMVIPQISKAINLHMQQQYGRFLLIFHNGSNEEVNLNSFGFPLFDQYSRSKVLWSFQGRFRAYPRTKVHGALKNTSATDVFLSADSSDIKEEKFSDILRHEAEEVAHEMKNVGDIDWSAAATNCFLYTVKLCRMGSDLASDYDLATHACNYWRCDSIMQLHQGDVCIDKLWSYYDALQCKLRLDAAKLQNPYFPSPMQRCSLKGMPYWTSPTYGFMLISDPLGQIPNCMFQQFDKLCVLKLSRCMFSFKSPPFLCCQNLRFLWLDHCQDGGSAAEAMKEEDTVRFFQRLWVLDVRYSKGFLSNEMIGFMTQLREFNVMGEDEWLDTRNVGDDDQWMDTTNVTGEHEWFKGQMYNIRKLRITRPHSWKRRRLIFMGRDKLELFECSGRYMKAFVPRGWSSIGIINCSSLEAVIISGHMLLRKITLKGCAKLKNIFLNGPFEYYIDIEIIGAAVETLDLSTVNTILIGQLSLRACGNLHAILWSPNMKAGGEKILHHLHIDTSTQKEGTTISEAGREFSWNISIRDERILWSLEPLKNYFGSKDTHIEISSTTHLWAYATGSKDNGIMGSEQLINDNVRIYTDVARALKAYEDARRDTMSPMIMRSCPPPPKMKRTDCYMHIDDPVRRNKSQSASITLPGFVCDAAKILHVHDTLHITSILAAPLASAVWNRLEWCQVEGCSNLNCVFSIHQTEGPRESSMFKELRTTWASHLPKAQYIWKCSDPSRREHSLFKGMTLLHIDYCPRLISITNVLLYENLDISVIEIMWCGNLSVIFSFDISSVLYGGWGFAKLKHIRLLELPKLQRIINEDIAAPELETIKIRGCWSLKRLPVLLDSEVFGELDSNKVVECNCEKEWWDRLEWKSAEHASQYRPTHPRHYKKTKIRGSVLR